MDPKGVLEMLLIFLEERGGGVPAISSPKNLEVIMYDLIKQRVNC